MHLLKRKLDPSEERYSGHRSLETSMQFISQLGDIYWHAEFYHELFELALNQIGNTPVEKSGEFDTALSFIKIAKNGGVKDHFCHLSAAQSREASHDKVLQRVSAVTRDPVAEDWEAKSGSSDSEDIMASEVEQNVLDQQNIETAIFEDWLRDCGYYYNSLPSA